MPRVLVTGGAGFLGSHLCERLVHQGHEVLCLDNFHTGHRDNVEALVASPRFELIRHDIVDPFHAEVDAIYHLACPASPVHYQRNPVRTIMTAVYGTRNVLELARDTGARLLIASTSEVYGDPEVHPQPESYRGHVNINGERACYDEGKRCAEALASSYAAQYGVEVRIARIFNTYGPRMAESDGRVISNFCLQALRGEPITIYGHGRQSRSFCYVSDLLDGLQQLMALLRDPGPVNLGSTEEMTMRELAALILELTASTSRIEHAPLPADDPARRRPDVSRARAVLDWQPAIGVREGVERTLAYFAARVPERGNGHAPALHRGTGQQAAAR